MLSLNKKGLILVIQLIYWGTPIRSSDNLITTDDSTIAADDTKDTVSSDDILNRKKRWITTGICMNYPMCCEDDKGKDNCGFFCPVCPIKRDYFGRPITTTTESPIQALLKLRAAGGGGGAGGGRLAALLAARGGGGGGRLAALLGGAGGGQGGGRGGALAALLGGAGGGGGGGGQLAALLGGANGPQRGSLEPSGGNAQTTRQLGGLLQNLRNSGGGIEALLRAQGTGGIGSLDSIGNIQDTKQLSGLLKRLQTSGVNLAQLAPLLQASGGKLNPQLISKLLGSGTGKGDSDLAGMMVVAAMIGAKLATGSKPDTPATSDEESAEEPDVTGSLATLIPAICARPEIIKNLIRRDPERVRSLARQFGFGELPENLTPENLDLSPICGKPGEPRPPPGLFGLPDLFANETVDVQGFGDYDYGDDYKDNEIDSSDKGFGDDYEGDFEGENSLSNSGSKLNALSNELNDIEDDGILRRNINVEPSNGKLDNHYFIDASSHRPNHRIPKQVTHPENFEYGVRYSFDHGNIKQNQNENVYPDVIALVDDQYIQDEQHRRIKRPHRRPVFRRRHPKSSLHGK